MEYEICGAAMTEYVSLKHETPSDNHTISTTKVQNNPYISKPNRAEWFN